MWGSPEQSNGIIIGYQLRFIDTSSPPITSTVDKLVSESFHIVTDNDIRSLGSNIQVQVLFMVYNIYFFCIII